MLRRIVFLQVGKRWYSATSPANLTSVSYKNGIKKITMCNPKTGNSLSIAMMQNLIDNISHVWDSKSLRVVLIKAEGKIFSSGHNLKELNSEAGRESQTKVFTVASNLMRTIIECPVPVIAVVDGYAVAAGCQLVAQCDLAVCSEESKFSTPGANVGIFCSTPGVALARSVPKSTALKMLFTGKMIEAKEAVQAGLVSHVCAKSEMGDTVNTLCNDIIDKSRAVIELGKRFYYEQVDESVLNAYDKGGRVMVENLNMPDGVEGVNSFIGKRKPNWMH